jgi:STE24 endopeptidase
VEAVALGVFVTWLVVLVDSATFPVALYRGYWLEKRYGLSLETLPRWLWDHLKALGLQVVLAIPAALVIYACIRQAPGWWWLYAGGAFAVFVVVLTHVAPVLLLPVFFSMRPLGNDSLRARLASLAQRAGTRVVGIYEWGLGEKTTKANAALVGMSRTRRILVSDTLVREYSEDEIEAILAHELAHHVHRDVWKGVLAETLLLLAGFVAGDILLRQWGPPLRLRGLDDPAGLPLLLLAAGGVGLAASPILKALSRRTERRADRFALDLTGNPDAFVSAIRRLGAQNLAEDDPSRSVRILFHTHPPIRERIEAARHWSPALSRSKG